MNQPLIDIVTDLLVEQAETVRKWYKAIQKTKNTADLKWMKEDVERMKVSLDYISDWVKYTEKQPLKGRKTKTPKRK